MNKPDDIPDLSALKTALEEHEADLSRARDSDAMLAFVSWDRAHKAAEALKVTHFKSVLEYAIWLECALEGKR